LLLVHDGNQELGHLVCPTDGAARSKRASAAISHERHTGGENLHECFQVAVRGRFEESLGDPALLGPVGVEAGPALADVLAGAAGELADRLLPAS